jgi:hypothetical protein
LYRCVWMQGSRLLAGAVFVETCSQVMLAYVGQWDLYGYVLKSLKNIAKYEEPRATLLRETEVRAHLSRSTRLPVAGAMSRTFVSAQRYFKGERGQHEMQRWSLRIAGAPIDDGLNLSCCCLISSRSARYCSRRRWWWPACTSGPSC